ncbi:hypothetical protein K449DRAFT_427604 [Hypoxylon sp. EC38]|nr:hypothetical protein K449DRAFT_427604 [Hypoxylon sp. EC38]
MDPSLVTGSTGSPEAGLEPGVPQRLDHQILLRNSAAAPEQFPPKRGRTVHNQHWRRGVYMHITPTSLSGSERYLRRSQIVVDLDGTNGAKATAECRVRQVQRQLPAHKRCQQYEKLGGGPLISKAIHDFRIRVSWS